MDYKKIIRSRAARENILRALAFIPDEAMLRIQYRIKTGRALHLKHPTRFTEKLQWYKLYYRDPDMLRCVDKYEVRAYLRERGFQDLLPRCFGVFDSPDQLPVPQLPDRFVLKDTLGSGGNAVLLCPDKDLTYDQHRDIRFVRENGPWYGKRLPFEVQFFHLGSLFQVSVPINEVIDGKAKPIDYSPAFFNYGKNDLKITDNHLGYAGFRLHNPLNSPTYYDELVSFLGASYFRALGKQQKYGLSARGLAIDTAVQTGEEFPIFREFWIQRPKRGDKSVTVYALLDSPSITGAYTFVITPGKQTVMDVDTVLIPRKAINKIGIAPLTSMFLFGENTKNRFDDHRPEVHENGFWTVNLERQRRSFMAAAG